ncbi:MAG: cytochrome c [Saprospiraceae bacterium]
MSKSKFLLFSLCLFLLIGCDSNPYAKGELVYKNMCASCHMDDGSGLGGNIPSLKNKTLYQDMGLLTCTITKGRINLENRSLAMPAFDQLSDIDLANLINFLNHQFGDDKQYLPNNVSNLKKACNE